VVSYANAGSHSIKAVYSGDGNYVESTSSTLTQKVAATATTTTLSSSGSPSARNGQVTYTATIASAPDGGTVSFNENLTAISGCGAQPITSGVASCVVTYPQAGSHSITAVYSGDNNYLESSSSTLTQTVAATATTTTLSSSGSPSPFGGQVTYTATIASAPDGGTVSFKDGQTVISGCGTQPITGGAATCGVSYTTAGSHSITAVYSGDSNYLESSSSALTQTVAATPTTTAPTPRPSVLAIAHQTMKVTTGGALKLEVTCRDSICTGTLKLTTRVTKTTGKGKHKRRKATTVTIATVSLSALSVHAHTVSVTLNKAGLRLLKSNHYKLSATATTTDKSGSTTKTASGAVTLKGTRSTQAKRK
jgi:hypothetical protein